VILKISRGYIKVELGSRVASVPGEMFCPGNYKLGFVVYSDMIKFWDSPDVNMPISEADKALILEGIRNDFTRSGHTLEIE